VLEVSFFHQILFKHKEQTDRQTDRHPGIRLNTIKVTQKGSSTEEKQNKNVANE